MFSRLALDRIDDATASRAHPRFVARLQERLADPAYHHQARRQLRLAILGVVIGLIGAVVSLSVLLSGGLEFRIGAFWLLCGLLSLGVFLVAEVGLIGGYVSQLAMQRLATGQKDCELFEAVRDYERLQARVAALQQMAMQTRAAALSTSLMVESIDYLADSSSLDPSPDVEKKVSKISQGWKAFGVDDGILARFAKG